MSLTAISPRRTRFALEIDAEPPASGFRIVGAVSQPFLRTMPASWTAPRPALLQAIGGHRQELPMIIGFDVTADRGLQSEEASPADADALPIDGSWRWLGVLSCWISSALVASLLVLALH